MAAPTLDETRIVRALEKSNELTVETMRTRYGEREASQYADKLLVEARKFIVMHDALTINRREGG